MQGKTVEAPSHRSDFLDAVVSGLSGSPKTLPCRFFYDFRGSQLFDQICDLPEYYLTRTEDELLRERADEIAARLPAGATLVELGSGTARKTRHLIGALLQRQRTLRYVPVDISHEMLDETASLLRTEFPRLEVTPVAAEYFAGMELLSRGGSHPQLVLFLGSNLGNFEPEEACRFLRGVRSMLDADDHALIGLDLRKEQTILEAAYDDSRGVTAAFNRNLLVRINRELGGDFRPEAFRHQAIYRDDLGRVEMHLLSDRAQTVTIAGREFHFAAGESIHTENSHKYSPAEIRRLASEAGLTLRTSWTDPREWFSLNLLRPNLP